MALLSVLLAGSWQWAMVHAAFQGNWTALFCAGSKTQLPPGLQSHEYVFHDVAGYDGQFYQFIAHDPFLTARYDRFIDTPRLRYRRILMPGLAWLLAVGRPDWIDAAYIAVCWGFIGLGTLCLAQLAVGSGRSELWGLLLLITPATLSAIERMTVDIGLTALAVAVILAARRERWLLLWLALAGAVLSKETGVLLVAGVVVWLARQQRFRLAAVLSTSLFPAFTWYVFVQLHTAGGYPTAGFHLFPFFAALSLPRDPGSIAILFRLATLASIVGLLWAAIRGIVLAIRDRFREMELLLTVTFAALLLLFQNGPIWEEPNGFTRIYSPLLVCLVAATWKNGWSQTVVQMGMVACPLCLQMAVHLGGPLLRLVSR